MTGKCLWRYAESEGGLDSLFRRTTDEWKLIVAAFFLGEKRRERTPPVARYKEVCTEIDALLRQTPGISAVRWYFTVGSRAGSVVVATPAELPWVESS